MWAPHLKHNKTNSKNLSFDSKNCFTVIQWLHTGFSPTGLLLSLSDADASYTVRYQEVTRSKCIWSFYIISNSTDISFLKIALIYYLLCVFVGRHTYLLEFSLSSHHMGPWDRTWVIRLSYKPQYLLCHHGFFHMISILLIFSEVYLGLHVYLFNILNQLLCGVY